MISLLLFLLLMILNINKLIASYE